MRERLKIEVQGLDEARITPARAGKTHHLRPRDPDYQDHPRSCGKDRIDDGCHRVATGSPPLVRERPYPGISLAAWIRITPARAGKT